MTSMTPSIGPVPAPSSAQKGERQQASAAKRVQKRWKEAHILNFSLVFTDLFLPIFHAAAPEQIL
tara:strand:+ start:3316 stop:3510 length:195 start_codon:yes stop_codon:yes gene_type:complete